MQSSSRTKKFALIVVRALVTVTLFGAFLVVAPPAPAASAQGGTTSLVVWDIAGGVIDNPKEWRFRQSASSTNDLGTATAAAPGLDDSGWQNVDLRWRAFPGENIANHFRKDFTLDEIGVELFQIEAIRVSIQYDDTAVMYLNGVEIYRSIRGNLDPDYDLYDLGDDIPYDVDIPYGGFEEFYVDIPNINGTNDCEFSGNSCGASPYGGPDTPEIPVSLLNADGVNTFAVTTWNRTAGGSGDSSLNHTFELLIDEDAVPPNPLFINEVMASNDSILGFDTDDDGDLDYPDWFEIQNRSSSPVNLNGWTVTDNSNSWVFPDVTIGANDFLVVVASDEDRTDLEYLQTNFKLSREGDMLRLTNPDGFLADEYEVLPRQINDVSYGRPNDTGTLAYLATPTPAESNSDAGDGYPPTIRPFADRLYNRGESVSDTIDAFDPDGDTLSYSVSPLPPGLSVDSLGEVSGTVTTAGIYVSTVSVTDGDGNTTSLVDNVTWTVLPSAPGGSPIVLNEYNAVAEDRALLGGSVVGNGGDWFEFLVIEDQLDLRGYRFEFTDRKGDDDQLRRTGTVIIGDSPLLANAPAGTIITFSEENADDLSFNGTNDWHINFQITNEATGSYFAPPLAGEAGQDPVFNSTRTGQTVVIRDAQGSLVTPLAGETDAWDEANGGVSGGEVLALCINPTPGIVLDPVTSYQDTGTESTFGEPNECTYPDPNNGTTIIDFSQDLSVLRGSTSFGGGSGDANCDLQMTVADAVLAAQYTVGNRSDGGPCFFNQGGGNAEVHVDGIDMNRDGQVTVADAVIIAQCTVGIQLQWCPE